MRQLAVLVLIPALTSVAIAQQSEPPASPYWLDVQVKARSMLVDPAAPTVPHEVMDAQAAPQGMRSPDGAKVAFIASDPQRVKDGHDFDLFVADVDPTQPSHKSNIRRLTEDQLHPVEPVWLADSDGLAFLAQRSVDDAQHQAWFVDLTREVQPILMSDPDALHVSQLSLATDGKLAYVQLNERKIKQQSSDLIVRTPPGRPTRQSEGSGVRTVIRGQHITACAISPDGRTLAWCEPATLHVVDLESGAAREIPLHGIHRQLINHLAYGLAWSPDGRLLAATFSFAGGIARGLNDDPNAPWPRMFAEDKVFIIPVKWSPSPQALEVGEGAAFPSPFANDEKAEISPSPGDQSKPWWVRGLPARAIELKWISADDAQARMNATK